MERKMKLAVISDEVSQDLAYVEGLVGLIDKFREYGLTGIEIRSLYDKGPHLLTDEQVEAIATASKSDRLGFEIPAIASPFFKCPFPKDQSAMDEQLKILARCIEIAQRLDAKIIRVFGFAHEGDLTLDAEKIQKITQAFQKPAEMAAEADVVLGIENEHTTNINSIGRLAWLLREIKHPNVKAVLDPANDVWSGFLSASMKIAEIRHYIVHIHVKDALPPKPGFPSYSPPIGLGVVPWDAILQFMTERKYDGWWSIETHYRLEALTKEQIDRPGGKEYSKGGYEATITCLHNFLEIVRRVGAR